jgi:hypothetical protein
MSKLGIPPVPLWTGWLSVSGSAMSNNEHTFADTNRHLVEVPDSFAIARWPRDADVATIARCILGTLKYEPHTADITMLRQSLEGVIKHETKVIEGIMKPAALAPPNQQSPEVALAAIPEPKPKHNEGAQTEEAQGEPQRGIGERFSAQSRLHVVGQVDK